MSLFRRRLMMSVIPSVIPPEPEGTYLFDFNDWWVVEDLAEKINNHQINLIGAKNSVGVGFTIPSDWEYLGKEITFTLNISGLEAAKQQYDDFKINIYTNGMGNDSNPLVEGDNTITFTVPTNAVTLFVYLRSDTSISENGMTTVPLNTPIVLKEIPQPIIE